MVSICSIVCLLLTPKCDVLMCGLDMLIHTCTSTRLKINWNWLKKFMQVGVDVTCMHPRFDGRGFFGFGDMATFQKRPNFPF